MWLPATSLDMGRHQAWKPVSVKDLTGQSPLPSAVSITQMPAVGAAALGRAGSHPSLLYRESNVLISDFLKLLPQKNARLLYGLVLHWPDVAGMQRQQ